MHLRYMTECYAPHFYGTQYYCNVYTDALRARQIQLYLFSDSVYETWDHTRLTKDARIMPILTTTLLSGVFAGRTLTL